MATQRQTDPSDLWRAIVQAGGVQPYIDAQLAERGFLVARRETDGLSDRELADYKKSLKAEAKERDRLRRETWAAYRAEHIVHLGDGVFWSDEPGPDKWDLPNAEVQAAENELPPLDSPRQLAEALGLTIPQLRWLAFHRDAARRIHYRRFTIPKRDGTERAIWAPMPRLKQAQHWILRNIAERLPVHGAAHGFLPGRSILSNAAAHHDPKVVVRIDLKDFFPTVTWRRVKGLFRKAGYREHVATLLALICTESPREVVEQDGETYYVALGPRCLPQGAPTSPAVTNALCLRLDRRLSGLARRQGWRYTRYADDLTFSRASGSDAPPAVGRLRGSVRRIVEAEGFAVHDKKTAVGRRGGRQSITGLVVNGDRPPRVDREFKRNLRAAIHNLASGKEPRDAEPPQVLAGRAAYVAMTDPALGKALLDELSRAVDQAAAGSPPRS
ncbi:reverse transcriptase family protein [Planctomyces sp. SH-PL62]|uniref:reverse transcriptase family protein n=1 Tax=Planctomyces sp. SH-PL62 TaxID=1636152 RepID=UPI00078B1737|nr:reverse transcriptase domain-containing protein [Planctomyces sp. SH-PL62]AMV40468.1 Reverse transcriptase (RNA-dependent DNA polymerase) [Planctomyces sp. SH-PL62]